MGPFTLPQLMEVNQEHQMELVFALVSSMLHVALLHRKQRHVVLLQIQRHKP